MVHDDIFSICSILVSNIRSTCFHRPISVYLKIVRHIYIFCSVNFPSYVYSCFEVVRRSGSFFVFSFPGYLQQPHDHTDLELREPPSFLLVRTPQRPQMGQGKETSDLLFIRHWLRDNDVQLRRINIYKYLYCTHLWTSEFHT